MTTNATLRQRLADIDATLAAGVSSVTVDGVTTVISLTSLRDERDRIKAQLPEFKSQRKARAFRVTGLGQ